MCGIISLFTQEKRYDKDVKDTIANLILADTVRGPHSTGIYYGKKGNTAGYYKKAIPGYDFLEMPPVTRILQDYNKYEFLVGHNRAATHGTINAQNAHPFQHGNITGVHNGTLSRYRSLTKNYYQTDSEHVFAALGEEEKDTAEVISNLEGSFVLLWHDASDDTMHIVRNSLRPFTFASIKNKKMLFGASEDDMVFWAATRNKLVVDKMWSPKPYIEYIFQLDGDLENPEEVEHKPYTPIFQGQKGHASGQGGRGTKPKKENVAGKDLEKHIGKEVEFFITGWKSYSNQSKDYAMGKCYGNTQALEGVWVFSCRKDDFPAGKYSGIVNSVSQNTLCIQSNSVKAIKESPSRKKQSTVNNTDTGVKPKVTFKNPNNRLITECVACREEHLISNVVYVDNAPVCKQCFSTYDIDPNVSDVMDGSKIC